MKQVAVVFSLLMVLGVAAWAAAPTQKEKQDDQAALRKEAKITMEQAQKTALAKEPGTIKSKELEKEKGKLIYSFDIQTKSGIHEVNVDALSGEVIEDAVESKAAEAKEKREDAKEKQQKKAQTPPPTTR